MIVILKGCGFSVGQDFARAAADIPLTIDAKAYAPGGHVVGDIAGDAASSLGFMRRPVVRVCVRRQHVAEV